MTGFVTKRTLAVVTTIVFATMSLVQGRLAHADDLVRVTSSFELKHAGAVVRQVAKVFDGGLGKGGAEKLTKELNAMPSDKSQVWSFTVHYHGADYPLQVRALLDGLGMLDLDFATVPAVAPAVRTAVDGYLNARGL